MLNAILLSDATSTLISITSLVVVGWQLSESCIQNSDQLSH